jgi:DNA-binding transcriptional LysR family regulator
MLPLITQFLLAYPQVDVRLVQGDRIANLIDDHIDLALRVGELPDSSLTATGVGSVRRMVCASPDYLSRRGTPTTPEELAEHCCVSFDALGVSYAWRFQTAGGERVIPVRSRLVVNTAEAAIDAAIAGVGITRVLSYQVPEEFKSGRLQRLLQDFESAPMPVSLLFDGRRRLPLKLRAFVDFATPRLRERLAGAA